MVDPLLHRARRPARGPGAAGRPAGRVPRRAARLPGQGPAGDGRRRASSSRGPGRSAATGWRGRRRTSRVLDIVLAVDGDEAAFRCGEIRQRGPAATAGSPRLSPAVRHRTGDVACRGRVASRAGGGVGRRHRHRALGDRARRAAGARGRVDPGRRRTTKEQDMKVFVAGATGVLGRATVPRLVAAGHDVRGAARSPEKADQLRAQGAEPVTVDLFDPVVGARGRRRVPGRGPHGHQHPAAHQGVEGRRLGDQRPPPPRGDTRPRRRLPRRRRGGAGQGDGVVLLRRRRRPVDRRGLAHRATAVQRGVARRRGHHPRLHRRRPTGCGAALRPLLLARRPRPRGEPEDGEARLRADGRPRRRLSGVDPRRRRRHRGGRGARRAGRRLQRGRRADHQRRVERRLRVGVRLQEAARHAARR